MSKGVIKTECRSISKLVCQFFEIVEDYMELSGKSMSAIAAERKLSHRILWSWKRGVNLPNLFTFETLLDSLGYELIIRKKQDAQSTTKPEHQEFDGRAGNVPNQGHRPLLHDYAGAAHQGSV